MLQRPKVVPIGRLDIRLISHLQWSTQPKHRPTVHTNGQRKREGTGSIFLSLLLFSKYLLYFIYVNPKTHWSLPQRLWALPDTKHRKGESLVLSFIDPRHTGCFLIASGHCQTLSTERGSLWYFLSLISVNLCDF